MSDGKLLQGQQFDPHKNLIVRYSEQMKDDVSAADNLGDPRTEVIPNDRGSSKVKIYEDATGLDSIVISGPSRTNLSSLIPDVLTSITTLYNTAGGDGTYVEDNISASGGDHADLTVSLQGSAQSSISLAVELNETIIPYSQRAASVPSTRYFFYMTGAVTTATILSRLATIVGSSVLELPVFKPMPLTFILKAQSASVRAEAKASQTDTTYPNYFLDSYQEGKGSSYDTQVAFRVVQYPPTLHAGFLITTPQIPGQATATATANIVGGQGFPPHLVTKTVASGILAASVTPSTVSATSPTTIPTSGLYLVDTNFESDQEWGRTKVFAEVVDFAYFA